MGLGTFGGGAGVSQFLVRVGARVTVTDMRPAHALKESLAALEGLPITYHLGGHEMADFTQADLVVVNPAVPSQSQYLAAARRHGVGLDTETNLLFKLCPAPILGVTGTNGKSTTAALLAEMLRQTGRGTWLSGNIGGSLLPQIDQIQRDHVVVLELSSFQLERLAWVRGSPHIAVVTNLSPNHLDRHRTMRRYAAAKRNILRFQTRRDFAVLNRDHAQVGRWGERMAGRVYGFGSGRCPRRGGRVEGTRVILRDGRRRAEVSLDRLRMRGPHNRLNVAAAATAAWIAGVTPAQIESGIAAFTPLPDRLEHVVTRGGVAWYNDSIATTPESAIAALRSFDEPILLIAGGYDKHVPLNAFAAEVASRTRAALLLGQTAAALLKAIRAAGLGTTRCRARVVASLAEAVAEARRAARPGDVALLSPGCASYDMFRNYRDRAEQFKKLVRGRIPKKS